MAGTVATDPAGPSAGGDAARVPSGSRRRGRPWRGGLGWLLVLVPVLASLAAPWLASYDPNEVDMARRLRPPSAEHWFGTDEVGRDLFARVLDGGRRTIGAGVGVVLLASTVGVVIGAVSGWAGGRLDQLLMRIMDIILAFPALVLGMALAAALGPGLVSAILAVAFVRMPVYARLVRAQVLSLREREYVTAAVAAGASTWHLVRRHLIPNSLPAVVVQATLDAGSAMLLTATLSFLGLGVRAPDAEWGAMVNSGRGFLLDYWWYPTFPGAAICITAVGFNLLGDYWRDRLDPREAAAIGRAGRRGPSGGQSTAHRTPGAPDRTPSHTPARN